MSAKRSIPRVKDGAVVGIAPRELASLAFGYTTLEYRADMARTVAASLPGFAEAHPDIEAVAVSCDPVLGNVIVAPVSTEMEYDPAKDLVIVRYEREAFCAESAAGAVMASYARVSGWVKVGFGADGNARVVYKSPARSAKGLLERSCACIGGSWPADTDAGAALALLVATSAVVSFERNGGKAVESVVRQDACAQGPETLRVRYAWKHAILDYGGFEEAEREEPGLVMSVFDDRRMWLWSFTEAPADVWGGTEMIEGTSIYEVSPAEGD